MRKSGAIVAIAALALLLTSVGVAANAEDGTPAPNGEPGPSPSSGSVQSSPSPAPEEHYAAPTITTPADGTYTNDRTPTFTGMGTGRFVAVMAGGPIHFLCAERLSGPTCTASTQRRGSQPHQGRRSRHS